MTKHADGKSNANSTKELFLQTASSLFANKGYHATGISEILKLSRAPKGSLYYYFPEGKEQLAMEALQKTSDMICSEIQATLTQYDDPITAFQMHLRFIAHKIENDMFRPGVSISLMALETFVDNERQRQSCKEIFDRIQKMHRDKLISCGCAAKTADFIAMTVSVMTEGAITLSLTRKDTAPLHALADNLPQLFEVYFKKRNS